MKYSVKYKRVFDKDGNIVDISNVNEANRLPEYYSIGSNTPMIAALGQTNQHYFRAKRGYQLNPETELHEYVKRILKHRFETEDHYVITWNGKDYYHCVYSHSDYKSALKDFTIIQGKTWLGGETLSDLCQ